MQAEVLDFYIFLRKHTKKCANWAHTVTNTQSKVLGPFLFTILLGNILHHHSFKFHFYADDTQLYIHSQCNAPFPTNYISACIEDINAWMTSNFLKLNTDLLLVGSPQITSRFCVDNVNIAGVLVRPPTTVKHLGIIFDFSPCSHFLTHQVCLLSPP